MHCLHPRHSFVLPHAVVSERNSIKWIPRVYHVKHKLAHLCVSSCTFKIQTNRDAWYGSFISCSLCTVEGKKDLRFHFSEIVKSLRTFSSVVWQQRAALVLLCETTWKVRTTTRCVAVCTCTCTWYMYVSGLFIGYNFIKQAQVLSLSGR